MKRGGSVGGVPSPVDDILQAGLQHDDQLLEGAPLLHVQRHLLLVFLVLEFFGQRDEDERTLLY